MRPTAPAPIDFEGSVCVYKLSAHPPEWNGMAYYYFLRIEPL